MHRWLAFAVVKRLGLMAKVSQQAATAACLHTHQPPYWDIPDIPFCTYPYPNVYLKKDGKDNMAPYNHNVKDGVFIHALFLHVVLFDGRMWCIHILYMSFRWFIRLEW